MQKNGKFTLKSGKDRGIYVDNGAIFSMCGGNITENSNKETRSVCRARGTSRRALGAMAARAMGDVFNHPNELHTTPLGAQRIQKNLALPACDVVAWRRAEIASAQAQITRRGKNRYVGTPRCRITIHARSCTIITAHPAENH